MSHPQSTTGSSAFERLPLEIMNMVFKELLIASDSLTPDALYQPSPTKPWPLSLQSGTNMDTGILRINHGINVIAKSYLDTRNKWVIFDIDNVHLLLPWAYVMVPIIFVDPDANYAIPRGIMQVRVKMCDDGFRMMNTWYSPAATPERQLVLVELKHVRAFLHQLRSMELANNIRSMPGEEYIGAYGAVQQAKRGFNGLTIRVHVDTDFPARMLKPVLECFRLFDGPLNEISILGSPETEQTRSIEASISAPRNDDCLTIHEVLMHVVALISTANNLASHGNWRLASAVYLQVRALPANSQELDRTPWSGWISDDWPNRKLELMLFAAAAVNSLVSVMQTGYMCPYQKIQAATEDGLIQQAHMVHLSAQGGICPEVRGWIGLISGLHLIFSARIAYMASDGARHLDRVRFGMATIEATVGTFEHLPESETSVFRAAIDMCTTLRLNDMLESKVDLMQSIGGFSKELNDLAKLPKFLVRWRFPASIIPQTLLDQGILKHLIDCSKMTQEEKNRVRIFNVFVAEEEEEEEEEQGSFYCI